MGVSGRVSTLTQEVSKGRSKEGLFFKGLGGFGREGRRGRVTASRLSPSVEVVR